MNHSLKTIVSAGIRQLPAPVIMAASRLLSRSLRTERFAHAIADRGTIPSHVSEIVIWTDPKLTLVNDGSRLSRVCYHIGYNAYEPGEADIWRKLCSRSQLILEVGGNIGYFTVLGAAAAKTASYHVVEPHPIVIKSLTANVARNKLDNVQVTQAAVVGDRAPGHVRLSVPNAETGRLSTGAYIDGAENDSPSSESFLVPTVRGSEIAAGVDLLKIDAEGAEAEILTAMDPVLAQSLPIIMLEVLPETPQLRLWIKRFSESHNYQLWALSRHPKQVLLQEIETVALNESYGTWDMLMVPAARLDRVTDIIRQ